MYMLHGMNTINDRMNSVVAIMLLNIILAVPAIIIIQVSCSDMSVLAFMSV